MATPEFGNDVVLAAGPDGRVASLVRAAGIVHAHAGVPIAIIGGLAVTCRLFGMQRATQDVDVVSDESPDVIAGAGTAADNLVNGGFAIRDNTSAPTRLGTSLRAWSPVGRRNRDNVRDHCDRHSDPRSHTGGDASGARRNETPRDPRSAQRHQEGIRRLGPVPTP